MKNSRSDQSITTVVRHFIKADKKQEFENWAKNINAVAQNFRGFLGLQLVPPPVGHHDYLILFKYSSFHTLESWMKSEERKGEIKKLEAISEKEMVIGEVTGIDFWFQAPETKTQGAPPKWKMAILTWFVVFPGVVLTSGMFRSLFPNLSPILTTFLVTLFLVPLLTWVLMPNLVKLFRSWLFSKMY